jgi:hypothetical protein
VGVGDVLGAPHVGEQLAVRDDAAAVPQQARQELELGGREVHRRAVALDPPGVEIDAQAVALERRSAGCSAEPRWRSATRMRASSSAEAEGLDQIVVGAGIEQGDLAGGLRARRSHHDRQAAVLADRPHQLGAVAVGQAEVEHDQPGRVVLQHRHRLAERDRGRHREALGGERKRAAGRGSRRRPRPRAP